MLTLLLRTFLPGLAILPVLPNVFSVLLFPDRARVASLPVSLFSLSPNTEDNLLIDRVVRAKGMFDRVVTDWPSVDRAEEDVAGAVGKESS